MQPIQKNPVEGKPIPATVPTILATSGAQITPGLWQALQAVLIIQCVNFFSPFDGDPTRKEHRFIPLASEETKEILKALLPALQGLRHYKPSLPSPKRALTTSAPVAEGLIAEHAIDDPLPKTSCPKENLEPRPLETREPPFSKERQFAAPLPEQEGSPIPNAILGAMQEEAPSLQEAMFARLAKRAGDDGKELLPLPKPISTPPPLPTALPTSPSQPPPRATPAPLPTAAPIMSAPLLPIAPLPLPQPQPLSQESPTPLPISFSQPSLQPSSAPSLLLTTTLPTPPFQPLLPQADPAPLFSSTPISTSAPTMAPPLPQARSFPLPRKMELPPPLQPAVQVQAEEMQRLSEGFFKSKGRDMALIDQDKASLQIVVQQGTHQESRGGQELLPLAPPYYPGLLPQQPSFQLKKKKKRRKDFEEEEERGKEETSY